MRWIASAFIFILPAAVVFSSALASQDQKASAFVLCKNRKDVRTIRVFPDQQSENCMITYSKGAKEEVVGNNRSAGACKSILKGIQRNLESSHWSCRNVQTALITTSSEVSADNLPAPATSVPGVIRQ